MMKNWEINGTEEIGFVTLTPGCACARNVGNVFPATDWKNRLVSYLAMHHDTCVTHVQWCMSGSLTEIENVPGIPDACATRNFTYLARGRWCTPPLLLICAQCTWLHGKLMVSYIERRCGTSIRGCDVTHAHSSPITNECIRMLTYKVTISEWLKIRYILGA